VHGQVINQHHLHLVKSWNSALQAQLLSGLKEALCRVRRIGVVIE